MWVRGLSRGFAVLAVCTVTAHGQSVPTAARIESVPLELTMPDRYQVAELLEPIRRVTLIAASDGFVRSMESRLGASVKESQEIVQLDRTEAAARLKMATAELKERQSGAGTDSIIRSRIEAAEARVELAQLALDRCTLRAPFAGRLVALPVCAGQYVVKGTVLAELADTSAFKTLVPVDRRGVSSGAPLTVQVEGQDVVGKVQAIMPLPSHFVALRDLATPFAAAWVVVPNLKGDLEPGLRVRPTTIPLAPIATVPRRAIKQDGAAGSETLMVQVIRNEYVTNVPVRVLGDTTTERTQITGLFRPSDALIVSASVPLLAGTLVRFGEGAGTQGIEGVAPNPAFGGVEAGITSPGAARGRTAGTGSGGSPRAPAASRARPASTPPPSPSQGAAPF